MEGHAFFTNDAIVFGLLAIILGFVFYTSNKKEGFWGGFYKYIPALLLCYMLPAVLNLLGLVDGESSKLYFVASRYLLPAAIVLFTISVDLKSILNLGPKALIMFITGTIGIIIGGPIAILIVSIFSPETVGGSGPTEVWKGLSTIAGSWIGGGANQAAMLEIYEYDKVEFGKMVLVDVLMANVWMAILLLGIGKTKRIDKWLKADSSSIETLKSKVSEFSDSVKRNPSLNDLMIILGIAFGAVGISHFGADHITQLFSDVPKSSTLYTFTKPFFWLVTIATIIGVSLSFTKAKNYEGAGASKLGSVFIYILVATIGMSIDLGSVFENPGLIIIGFIWISIHAILLIIVAKLIKAPYFFLAVGSQANVGGAASAPVVAAEFHPSLASVGVLLAVFGYVVGTYGAILCTILMQMAAAG
ncbi:membrane protein [Dokdonia pacifica]|uniref:Uncharacterized membrane protein n=1 Tax=Dokdonia pacifica TaxID=1627892 RepID=A0A239D792_9FLAO|nr:DUF819 family protein [Dokdonia pacifica]GGG40616.1 membrane protein [Dokdonia pacifica]SNS27878.1 Uncharacterized membrane protein [Dokdonia pacifica]